ncbi:MAG: argininosuccinate lyase [Actinobacteria bacterium]|nr:argininosuccinate lyase [Actinomycetota bacterium]
MEKERIWKGRIDADPDSLAAKFTSSIIIDRQLYMQDITGTAAYIIGLKDIGIISGPELKKLLRGLEKVRNAIEAGKIDFNKYEDIHSLVEYELLAHAGDVGAKVHTGRSRNDQIVVDELIFLKESLLKALNLMLKLEEALLDKALKFQGLALPAYTHMQQAQPVLVSHYLLCFFEKFIRNIYKLFDTFESCDYLPLGAAACAGSGYGLNTDLLARLLKFKRVGANSMDIVSSRDYIIDYVYCCTMIMLNLSRFCEDMIIYNSGEFSYINIDDSFCTGSSIMPQKKNPDILELIRGKSALVSGSLMQAITLFKGLPLTYNSDMQEDKKILFNAALETMQSIEIFTKVLENIEFKVLRVNEDKAPGFTCATDAADYLVRKGESFRNAHHIIGRIVKYCIENEISLEDIPLEKLKEHSSFFSDDFKDAIRLEKCISSKKTVCGTSEKSVEKNISRGIGKIKKLSQTANDLKSRIPDFDELLSKKN